MQSFPAFYLSAALAGSRSGLFLPISPSQHSQIMKEKEPESPLLSENPIIQAYDQSSPSEPVQLQDIVQPIKLNICEFEAKLPLIVPAVASIIPLQPEAPSNASNPAEEMQLVPDQPDYTPFVSPQSQIYPLQPTISAVSPLFPPVSPFQKDNSPLPAYPSNPFLSPVPIPSSTYSFVFGAQPSFDHFPATSQPVPSVSSPQVNTRVSLFGSVTGHFGAPQTGGFNMGVVKKRTSR